LQNGRSTHPQDIDAPLHIAAQRKINSYRQQNADNQNISFLPTITSTSTRMHGEFLRVLFLQAHRETEAHFTATGMPSRRNQSDSFRFKRAAFFQLLKSKVGLAAAKAAALRININVEGCGMVAAPMPRLSQPCRGGRARRVQQCVHKPDGARKCQVTQIISTINDDARGRTEFPPSVEEMAAALRWIRGATLLHALPFFSASFFHTISLSPALSSA